MKRVALAVAAIGVVLATAAPPAYAASGRIREVSSADGVLTVVFSAADLPKGAALDPASIEVTADGKALAAQPIEDAAAAPVLRTAMLVIDTSGSMRGEGIDGAKAAALSFVNGIPKDVRIGLVSFSDTARVDVRPTTDRAAVRAAVQKLAAKGETALFDGVALGLAELGGAGVRSLLVLSDGADTASRASLAQVVARTAATKVAVDTVGFRTDDAVGSTLAQISRASRGRSLTATSVAALGSAFSQVARDVASQVTVRAPIPAALAGQQVTVRVAGRAGADQIADEAVTTLGAAATKSADAIAIGPRPAELDQMFLQSEALLGPALALLFVGLLVLLTVGGGALRRDAQSGRVRQRLSLYTLTGRGKAPETSALGNSAVARSALDLAGRVVQRRDLETRLALRLEQADVSLRPAEWLLTHFGCAVLPALLVLLLTNGNPVPTLMTLFLGAVLPLGYLSVKATRRTRLFLAQMPDTLQLLAGGLSAGYSLPQALDSVVREGAQPIAKEFHRALVESRLGVPVEDALDDIAVRMDSKDFEWVVMAIRIQREVGGNLAEVLTTVAGTMRERERVRRQVRVLSAEGRLSAWILGGLPPLFGMYLLLVNPTYIKPLFTDPIGLVMLAFMGVLLVIGVLWMRKAVRVEV
ncbi:MAG TPA: type II secretion system F family protein [Mycobacteriales bacterium]|nr:type II secretion system F family protein [Mycobacteriales bacterium]